jgi:hypothetical protein
LRGFTEAFHVLERIGRNGGELGVRLPRAAPKTHRTALPLRAAFIRHLKSNLGELS